VTVYGASADGDIYALGRPLRTASAAGNTIRNSRAYNFAFGDNSHAVDVRVSGGGQAFGCDAQQSNCLIEGCYAFGYYFSFDCKGGTVGCTFANNVAERTKIGLACRPGEAPYIPPYQCTFANNKVFPERGNGNPNDADYFGGVTSEACFFLQDAYNAKIQGNTCETIGYQPNVSAIDDFVGVFAVVDNTFASDPALMGGVELQNNTFVMSQTVSGATTITSRNYAIYAAGKNLQTFPMFSVSGGSIKPAPGAARRAAIYIENAKNVSILGVIIEPFGGSAAAPAIALKGTTNVLVANNVLPSPGVFLRADDSANINVNGNVIGNTVAMAIYSVNSTGWTVAGNTKTQVGAGDDVLFRTRDGDPCPSSSRPILLAGNNIRSVSATAMSRICGMDDYSGEGITRSGNGMNGTPRDNPNRTTNSKGQNGQR
jgi:hypothetical protein